MYLEHSHKYIKWDLNKFWKRGLLKIFLGMRGYDILLLLFLFNPPTLIFGKRSWKTTDNKKIVFSYNLSFYWHSKSASEGFGFNSFLMCINTNFKSTLVAWKFISNRAWTHASSWIHMQTVQSRTLKCLWYCTFKLP